MAATNHQPKTRKLQRALELAEFKRTFGNAPTIKEFMRQANSLHGTFSVKKITGYSSLGSPISYECGHCGKHIRLPAARRLLTMVYSCECQHSKATFPFAFLGKREKHFVNFLYTDLYYTVPQIAELTGLKDCTIRHVLSEAGVRRSVNQHNGARKLLEKRATGATVDSVTYTKHARVVTKYVFNAYKRILDPKDLRLKNPGEYHLDHQFSIADAYYKYRIPVSLSLVCHPANLKILTAKANHKKFSKSAFSIIGLKQRIKKFEKKHGKVIFPETLQLEFASKNLVSTKIKTGINVLGFDPGSSNFGVFGGTLYGVKTLHYVRPIVTKLLENPIKSLSRDLESQMAAYCLEMRALIEMVNPEVIIIERFQSRGLKGLTVELVNFMIGLLAAIADKCALELGHPIYVRPITASQWKNSVNRQFSLEDLYAELPTSQRHRLDACLMSLTAFPCKDVYAQLTAERQNKLITYMMKY